MKTIKFIRKAKKIWGDKYEYSEVTYVDAITPVIIIYMGKRYNQTPKKHLSRKAIELSCIKMSTEEFIERSKLVWGVDRFNYSMCEYIGSNDKVKLFDNKNNTWIEQTAKSNLSGFDSNKKDLEHFIRSCDLLHDFKYDYSLVPLSYKDALSRIKIICKNHGEFELKATSHYNTVSGCPKCINPSKKLISKFLRERNINFVSSKRFDDCRFNGDEIPFDFYIPSFNTIIEVLGEIGDERLVLCNKIKVDYCEDRYINLIQMKEKDVNVKTIYESLSIFFKMRY